MKPGPAPKPSALEQLQGNPRRRPANHLEPKIPGGRVTCPKHLAGAARAEWARLCPVLTNSGVLKQTDRGMLAAYCVEYGRWVDAERRLRKTGVTVQTAAGNTIQNPDLAIARKGLALMVKIGAELGLTPAARTRVNVDEPAAKSTGLDDIIGRVGD